MQARKLISRAIVTVSLVVVVAIMLGSATVASACPSCQEALASDTTQGNFANGIYYSILFMMSMPFAIVGTFAGFAYRAVKREQRRQAEANAADMQRD
jgi:p-aminobenzoyl-glutamate transporter AbgT